MHLHRRSLAGALLLILAATTALFGCRAFEPEVVIVNKGPETYVTGSPIEGGGGQFHFHVFWYGTDRDGSVERYVWALTDGTIQDSTTDEDEEDTRFNPAVSITTLDIGHWTTRTDTIFDFQINDGSITSADMTFHIVAVDDRGDFDRTPARLYFLSNALGVPSLEFFTSPEPAAEFAFTNFDTIGYGVPFDFSWRGGTPNINSFTPELLAARDTIPPLDGLYGYKYKLPTDVLCDDAIEDCWNPRRFDPAQNRDASYFADISHLGFANDGPAGADVSERRLASGVHTLMVNTIDVAGVEIPSENQSLNFVINYDPETYILGHVKPFDLDGDGQIEAGEALNYSQDPFYDDPETYPFYRIYRPDGSVVKRTFAEHARLPHRSVAVFKGIGWDDPRDVRFADIPGAEPSDFEVQFQGKFFATGKYLGGNLEFGFSTQYNETVNSVWDDYADPSVGASDTISFTVGPFEYDFLMRTKDEHTRRDGTPDLFHFWGNNQPSVQCVEVVPDGTASGYPGDLCAAEVDTFVCHMLHTAPVATHPEWTNLRRTNATPIIIWINPTTSAIWYDGVPSNPVGYNMVQCFVFAYDVLLYGQDHEDERLFIARNSPLGQSYGNPADRAFAWRYQITSHADSLTNLIREGTGFDDITQINYTMADVYANNFDNNGVWRLPVSVYIPLQALSSPSVWYATINSTSPYNLMTQEMRDRFYDLSLYQTGLTTLRTVMRDGTLGSLRTERCGYPYFTNTRVPAVHGESCDIIYDDLAAVARYEFFFAESDVYEKQYVIKLYSDTTGEIYPPMPE